MASGVLAEREERVSHAPHLTGELARRARRPESVTAFAHQTAGGSETDRTGNVIGLSDDASVHLAGWFSNPRKPLMTLIRRVLRGSRRPVSRSERRPIEDVRGPVAESSLRPQTRLSVPKRAALAEEYAKGVSIDELARRFGIHRTTVHRFAAQAGVAVRRRGLDEPGRREAARLYEQGMTLEEVATELGVGKEVVRSAVVACSGTIRRRGRRSDV